MKFTYSFRYLDKTNYTIDNSLGVWLYDTKIYFSNAPNFNQTYKVRFIIKYEGFHTVFEVIETFNLKDYLIEVEKNHFKDNSKYIEFDFDSFIKDKIESNSNNLTFFDIHKTRLVKLFSNIIPKPNYIDNDKTTEFLEFDYSSECWSGPYEVNGKLGCHLIIFNDKKTFRENRTKLMELNFLKNCHSFCFPNRLNLGGNDYFRMNELEKLDYINSISDKDFFELYKNVIKWLGDEESLERNKQYQIYLSGNDDTTYSKWFFTEEDCNKEIDYLRKMQPLNYWDDIKDRGYIFTN